jgi:hypothetical protein
VTVEEIREEMAKALAAVEPERIAPLRENPDVVYFARVVHDACKVLTWNLDHPEENGPIESTVANLRSARRIVADLIQHPPLTQLPPVPGSGGRPMTIRTEFDPITGRRAR